LPLALLQRTQRLGRIAGIDMAALETLARGHHGAGSDDHLVLDHRAVHHDGAHAHQDAIAQRAAVQDRLVADGDVVADGEWGNRRG
jgi:hypothetical protein